MFTMNMTRGARTAEGLELVRGYCPVAHGYQIGGVYAAPLVDGAPPGRLRHL